VRLDGIRRDAEPRRDLFVRQAISKERQDLALAIRQHDPNDGVAIRWPSNGVRCVDVVSDKDNVNRGRNVVLRRRHREDVERRIGA
jgi:hypothetical protein